MEDINITGLIALAAIVSPIIVSVIDNIYRGRRYDQEIKGERSYVMVQKRNNMIDDYLISLGVLSVQIGFGYDTQSNYKERYYVLLPYVGEEVKELMMDIDKHIELLEYSNINNNISTLTDLLKNYKNE